MTRAGVSILDGKAAVFNFQPAGAMTATSQFNVDPSKSSVGQLTLTTTSGNSIDLVQQKALQSGTLAALVNLRDTTLVQAQGELDSIAAGVSKAFSTTQTAGTATTAGGKSGYSLSLGTIRDGDDFFVGPELQAAVGRAINQLRLLDAHEGEIRRELVVECRRASATVVAGHPTYLADPAMANDERVMEAIRIYNSHLSGIEVVTYQELVEGAERALLVSVQVTDSADRDLESDFI